MELHGFVIQLHLLRALVVNLLIRASQSYPSLEMLLEACTLHASCSIYCVYLLRIFSSVSLDRNLMHVTRGCVLCYQYYNIIGQLTLREGWGTSPPPYSIVK